MATSETRGSNFEAGVLAYHNGLYEEAEALWLRVDSGPDLAKAAYNLAILYEQGLGRSNYDGAYLYWYRTAAEAGSLEAQYNLGGLYYRGERVPRNLSDAVFWWAQAANRGHAEAQYNLGVILSNGRDFPVDTEKAKEWLAMAARQGYAPAQQLLTALDDPEQQDSSPLEADFAPGWEARHELWFYRQDPADFTLEFMRAKSLSELSLFIRRANIQAVARVYRTDDDYVLVAGLFNTESEARAAVDNLTEAVRAVNPGPRQFAGIHGEMRSN